MKKVIVYFNEKKLIENAQQGIDFINSLHYRGNSYKLECNESTENLLKDVFDGVDNPYLKGRLDIATTGCSTTRIYLYASLADTLLEHDSIVLKNETERKEKESQERIKADIEFQKRIREINRGWYIVTVTGLAMKLKGNDGSVTKSVKVLANSEFEAFEMAVKNLEENPSKNIMMWMFFENIKNSLIEFAGVWTDELELEYRT